MGFAEQNVALRPGPHFIFARHLAVAAAPAGELFRSASEKAAMANDRLPHEDLDPTGVTFAKAAKRAGCPIDVVCFVSDALFYAPRYVGELEWGGHVRGQKLCTALVKYAQDQFGEDAKDALGDWGLISGKDVGRIVDALIAEGLTRPSERDSFADFQEAGLLF